MIIKSQLEPLDYDDVLLVPEHSYIKSRKDVNLFVANKKYMPIFSAPMRGISTVSFIKELSKLGGIGILHRFFSTESERLEAIMQLKGTKNYGISIGINQWKKELVYVKLSVENGAKFICIDTATGHMQRTIDSVGLLNEYRKENDLNFEIISGNVATYEGAYHLAQAGSDFIRVGIGGGCFGAGTRILMADGTYKNIEKINVEDEVIDGLGYPTKVVGVKRTGIRKVMRYRSNVGKGWVYCTPEHLHKIYNFKEFADSSISSQKIKMANYHQPEWGFIFDNTKKTFLVYPNKIYFKIQETFNINLLDYAIRDSFIFDESKSINPDYDLGYIFGTFLGDGNSSLLDIDGKEQGKVTWYFHINQDEISKKLCDALYKKFGKEVVPKKETKNNTQVIQYNYQSLARFFQEFSSKDKKHLPSKYFCSNKEYLTGLFDGLIDSDGSIEEYGRISFANTSKDLIELFGIICYLLYGSFPSVSLRGKKTGNLRGIKKGNFKDSFSSRLGTTHDSQHANFYTLTNFLEKEMLDFEVPVYDIEVESEDHSFIAENVVVHNSVCSTRNATSVGIPDLTAIQDCSNIKNLYPNIKIIADGGIKNSGRAMKAFVFGADYVMIGSLFGKSKESNNGGIVHGMSSYKLQNEMGKHLKSNEGLVMQIPQEDIRPLKEIYEEFIWGLRSGLSYLDCSDINELHNQEVTYIRTGNGTLKKL